jgi:uncharacterized protein (TIGR02646 family)
MIGVRRGPEPLVLRRRKERWDRELQQATTRKEVARAISKYRHKQIKEALLGLFHSKCAYCESKILHVDYGDIEHFRPKARPEFRGFVFDWRNLLLSCAVCNGPSFKGDRFPNADAGGPPINPCDDLPEEHLSFLFDIAARVATVVAKTERGRVTIELFGLNRPDLREYRSRFTEKLLVLSRFAAADEEAHRLLEEARADSAEYAAFSRTLTT